jgi:hypothetical protein
MAKFLRNVNGLPTEVNTITTSAGAADADKIPSLDPSGKWDITMMPNGIGADSVSIQASEALAAGDFVNIHAVTGQPRIRKASAAAVGTMAHGYVLSAVASGAQGTVFFDEMNSQVTGKAPGATQFLSATNPGQTVETAPSAAGQIAQIVGFAASATAIHVAVQQPIVLA